MPSTLIDKSRLTATSDIRTGRRSSSDQRRDTPQRGDIQPASGTLVARSTRDGRIGNTLPPRGLPSRERDPRHRRRYSDTDIRDHPPVAGDPLPSAGRDREHGALGRMVARGASADRDRCLPRLFRRPLRSLRRAPLLPGRRPENRLGRSSRRVAAHHGPPHAEPALHHPRRLRRHQPLLRRSGSLGDQRTGVRCFGNQVRGNR